MRAWCNTSGMDCFLPLLRLDTLRGIHRCSEQSIAFRSCLLIPFCGLFCRARLDFPSRLGVHRTAGAHRARVASHVAASKTSHCKLECGTRVPSFSSHHFTACAIHSFCSSVDRSDGGQCSLHRAASLSSSRDAGLLPPRR